MLAQTITQYVLSPAYHYGEDYKILQLVLEQFKWPSMQDAAPMIAPDICVQCKRVLGENVLYGRVWRYGCPICKNTLHTCIPHYELSDLHAILSRRLSSWEIDALIATELHRQYHLRLTKKKLDENSIMPYNTTNLEGQGHTL